MKLSIGIVGLPNVGKSTLFKILTQQEVHIANYPFATIDPNVGVVAVPDERLERLYEMSLPKASSAQGSGVPKKIPAVVEFYDIAGLVKGASKGEGLGNQFLSHIRETAAILFVLRVFKDEQIIHVENSVDPVRDLEILLSELCLKDLESVTRRLDKAESEAKSGSKEAVQEVDILKKVKEVLEKGEPARLSASGGNKRMAELNLLTAKAMLFLLNGRKEDVPDALIAKILALKGDFIVMNLKPDDSLEIPLRQPADQNDSVNELIRKAYKNLNLISFFTTGEDETRAWTVERGTKAPQAAGVIHTDFEKNFIRAEVINWDMLLASGTWQLAKQKGLIRLEGKDYVVQDGDVIVVRHG